MNPPTLEFIKVLQSLKPGGLGLLRKHADCPLDASLDAFDLFAGIWWPLRARNERAPRREVAWLVAKLFAHRPLANRPGATLPSLLGRLRLSDRNARARIQQQFDQMLLLPLGALEPSLRWAVSAVADHGGLDWAHLTDKLSIWQHEDTRLEWAQQFLGIRNPAT